MSTPSLTTPPSWPLDAFGEPLRLHDLVVFNQGGALNIGMIIRITPKRKPSCTPALLPYHGRILTIGLDSGMTATVQNTQGVLRAVTLAAQFNAAPATPTP